MRVLIYGGGAVGLGLASCCIQGGAEVAVVARPATVAALRAEGLRRTGLFGPFEAAWGAFEAVASLGELRSRRPFGFVLVCVKSFDSGVAAADLADRRDLLGPDGRIVLCQNGWGNAEVFAQRFPTSRIVNARVITGFARPSPSRVDVTVHADAIRIGSLYTSETAWARPLCEAIAAGGIPCQPTATIGRRDLWAKMLYNCALNPLGAILGVPYGRLGESNSTRFLMERIVEEVYAVMGAAGYETHWPTPAGFLEAFYRRQLPATAAHESSMLQDLRAGRRTEIDALSGAVVALADRHGLPAGYNRCLAEMIAFLTEAKAAGH